MLSPLQAMVRSTSRRSDPLSIIHTASGGLAHYPRVLCTRADLIADTQGPVANKSVANSYPAGQPTDGRLTLDPGPVPASPGGPGHSLPATLPRAPTITVRVTVIICSAIGGPFLLRVSWLLSMLCGSGAGSGGFRVVRMCLGPVRL
jgi:hypothetical protein